jgi:hypothetical protein
MFITKEEADRRRDDSKNLFSQNYIKPTTGPIERQDPEVVGPDGADSTPLDNKDIDAILTRAVDPSTIRRRTSTLHGQKDVQVAIGTSAMILGDAGAGRLYGLSGEQTRAYEQGLSSTKNITEGRAPDPERKLRLGAVKEALAEAAAGRLNHALKSLTNDKIAECSAPKLSMIAKDMSVVMDKVTKDNSMPESIHFHVFRPEIKSLGDYTTVHVSAPIIGQTVQREE